LAAKRSDADAEVCATRRIMVLAQCRLRQGRGYGSFLRQFGQWLRRKQPSSSQWSSSRATQLVGTLRAQQGIRVGSWRRLSGNL